MKQKKRSKQKDILFIFISSFVVVVAWIGFNLYHIWITSTISEDIQSHLTPIEGRFDIETMQKLKTRERVIPAFERQTSPSQVSPTPTTVSPLASESADLESSIAPISGLGQ